MMQIGHSSHQMKYLNSLSHMVEVFEKHYERYEALALRRED
jgi:hypothetical protein